MLANEMRQLYSRYLHLLCDTTNGPIEPCFRLRIERKALTKDPGPNMCSHGPTVRRSWLAVRQAVLAARLQRFSALL
jgi:hypothetical protein